MEVVTIDDVKKLVLPARGSHKGQNGRLLIIGGSELFHAASLWALTVASRIVDLVHYASTPENNMLVANAKSEFRNGIVVPRSNLDEYIGEDDCILMGLGMTRDSETETLTNSLLKKYPNRRWVIDAGSLQMMDISLIPINSILTPHHGEFKLLWGKAISRQPSVVSKMDSDEERVTWFAKQYHCVVLLKGDVDIACDGRGSDAAVGVKNCRMIEGGNPGMTKGGTGDVLSGLIAALSCKNDPFLATIAGSFINKKAGDELFTKVGPFFNATDLANQIPVTMKELLIS